MLFFVHFLPIIGGFRYQKMGFVIDICPVSFKSGHAAIRLSWTYQIHHILLSSIPTCVYFIHSSRS